MHENKKILGIIPARGGSKGILRKNIRLLAGKPLIAYSIDAAKNSKYIDRVVVSTEDEEIAKVAKIYGADVIKRPKELAEDESPTIDAIFHVLKTLQLDGYVPDIVIVLQPTSPLRTHEDIDKAISIFLKCNKCLSLVSITDFEHPPFWALKKENGFLCPVFGERYLKKRRQELPKVYKPNGAIFIASPSVLYKYKTFYTPKTVAYVMPKERSVDIDNEFNFLVAEFLIRWRKNGEKHE